jgi:hypothetical protein
VHAIQRHHHIVLERNRLLAALGGARELGADGGEGGLASHVTVDALLLVREYLLVVLAAGLVGDLDNGVAHDNAHLVVLATGELAGVLAALNNQTHVSLNIRLPLPPPAAKRVHRTPDDPATTPLMPSS